MLLDQSTLTNNKRGELLDPETCLRHANDKFSRRFNAMERMLAAEGRDLKNESLEAMEDAWRAVKRGE